MRVLLAIDHSTASDLAVEYVKKLRFSEPVELTIVTVISPVPFVEVGDSGAPADIGGLLQEETEHIESKLAETKLALDDGTYESVRTEIKIGMPGQEIKALAETSQCELVILGAVGHSSLARVVLGSVSDYVATHAAASALVVREAESGSVQQPHRILLAIDCSEQDHNLIRWLERLKLADDCEIHTVYVQRLLTYYSQDVIQRATERWKQTREMAEKHSGELADSIRAAGFQDVVSRVIPAAHSGNTLIEYAESNHCDLIVTGDHQRGAVSRFFLGSTSRDVLRSAGCSVLIARTHSAE